MHIQPLNGLYSANLPVWAANKFTVEMQLSRIMVFNLYSPAVMANRDRNWHLLRLSEGCQRVVEPDLSPLLYKSNPVWGI